MGQRLSRLALVDPTNTKGCHLMKARVRKERDVRTHANLWHTSMCLLEKGQEQERASFHQFMGSLVFTAFTLEAYLNWLGDKLFPHWKYLQRLSPREKLEVISDQLKVAVDWGARPWQIVKHLFDFRNDIAHGKPENLATDRVESVGDDFDAKMGKADQTRWEAFCTRQNAKQAREDVAKMLETLHSAAKMKDPGPFFRGFRSHHATLVKDDLQPLA